MEPYKANIEDETLGNDYYRKVLFTGSKMQLVAMSLKVDDDIPMEVHPHIDQFIRVEKGEALVKVDGKEFSLKDDDVVIIPAGSEHYVKNTSSTEELKIYTIYATPEHPEGTIHKTREEALKAHDEEHH